MDASCKCSRIVGINISTDDHLGGVGEKAPQLGEVAVDPLPAAALGLAVATRSGQCLSVRHLLRRHAPQLRLQAPQQPRHHPLAAPLRRELLLLLMMPLVLLLLLHRIEAEAEHAKDAAEGRPHGRRIGERRGSEPGSEQLMVLSLLAPVLDAPIPHGCLGCC
jgi:hypothetical protein